MQRWQQSDIATLTGFTFSCKLFPNTSSVTRVGSEPIRVWVWHLWVFEIWFEWWLTLVLFPGLFLLWVHYLHLARLSTTLLRVERWYFIRWQHVESGGCCAGCLRWIIALLSWPTKAENLLTYVNCPILMAQVPYPAPPSPINDQHHVSIHIGLVLLGWKIRSHLPGRRTRSRQHYPRHPLHIFSTWPRSISEMTIMCVQGVWGGCCEWVGFVCWMHLDLRSWLTKRNRQPWSTKSMPDVLLETTTIRIHSVWYGHCWDGLVRWRLRLAEAAGLANLFSWLTLHWWLVSDLVVPVLDNRQMCLVCDWSGGLWESRVICQESAGPLVSRPCSRYYHHTTFDLYWVVLLISSGDSK